MFEHYEEMKFIKDLSSVEGKIYGYVYKVLDVNYGRPFRVDNLNIG